MASSSVLLLGYYGHRNIGDDLFVRNLVDFLARQHKRVAVICEDDYYQENYADQAHIRFYRSQDLSKLKRLELILKSDIIAWGGGTLNMNEAPRNLVLSQRVARLLNKKFGFLGVGLDLGQAMSDSAQTLFDKANFLYVRNAQSYEFVTQHLPTPKICCLGGDLAFLDLSFYQRFIPSKRNSTIRNLSFSGKHWWGRSRAARYATPLRQLIDRYNTQIHLLPGNVGAQSNDNRFHEKLQQLLPASHCTLHTWDQPETFMKVLGGMDFHIGNRLHSVILADILGVPNIGINTSPPKIAHYIQKTGVLPEARLVDAEVTIPGEQIEQVFQQYQRPSDFIEAEARTAQECLQQVLAR